MPLPILEASKYQTVIPSTGKRVEFRPFLVKEEKILLLAQESKDTNQIIRALKDIIEACTFNKIQANDLTTYDLEYLFLQLRAKSVGELVDLTIKCKNCGGIVPTQLDLNEVNVEKPSKKIDPKIQLTDSIGVTLRAIPISEIDSISEDTEDFIRMIALCIESIYDNSNVYHRKDTTEKELITFVESLSHGQLKKFEEYITNQPKLTHKIKFNCIHCNTKNEVVLQGLQDFFV
jgi:transcription elongation factor Elf1